MAKYFLEFILSLHNISCEKAADSIREFGENLEVIPLPQDGISLSRDFKINISTDEPTIIFDTCGQFGRIKSVKVNEC